MLQERRFLCMSYEPGSPWVGGGAAGVCSSGLALGAPGEMKRSRSLEDLRSPPLRGLASSLAFCRRRGR